MTEANTSTVKERALAYLAASLARDIQISTPTNDPYGVVFTAVYRDPPDEAQIKGKKALAVVLDGAEIKRELSYGRVDCTLSVVIEVHVFKSVGEVSGERINAHMGAVERLLRSDRTLGGTTVELVVDETEVSPEGPYENYYAGALRVSMLYRHHTDDPRQDA